MKISSRELSDHMYALSWFYSSESHRAAACGNDELDRQLEKKADEVKSLADAIYSAKCEFDTEKK